ncbi:hypothetical protein BJ742DRAFT_809987 [Cladochytrium replicatum]|nr:hypothetical protein BJ742DRAFT_809987 [Cladochytrium replicatum]
MLSSLSQLRFRPFLSVLPRRKSSMAAVQSITLSAQHLWAEVQELRAKNELLNAETKTLFAETKTLLAEKAETERREKISALTEMRESLTLMRLRDMLNLRGAIELAAERYQNHLRDTNTPYIPSGVQNLLSHMINEQDWVKHAESTGRGRLADILKCQQHLYRSLSNYAHGVQDFDISEIEAPAERAAVKATLQFKHVAFRESKC